VYDAPLVTLMRELSKRRIARVRIRGAGA